MKFYEVEMDISNELAKVDTDATASLRRAGKGRVMIGVSDEEVHEIRGGDHLTKGVGYRITDGLVEILVHEQSKVLRTYGSWQWVEGDRYERAPSQTW